MFEALSIFENTTFLLIAVILFTVMYSATSKSFIYASFAGFLMFIALAIETQYSVLINSMYVLVVGMTIISAFQIYNLSNTDTTEV